MITQEELKELFSYNQDGTFSRIKNVKGVRKGKPVGCNSESFEYILIGVNGKQILGHVAVWIWHNGQKTVGFDIDHINGNKKDNRIENLRLATRSENNQNRKKHNKNSKTKSKGVTKVGNKFRVTLWIERKAIHIGYFESIEIAEEARKKAEETYHPFRSTNNCGSIL